MALVFDAKYRAEVERRQRAESVRSWIDDWRARTGVKHITSAGVPADASKAVDGSRAGGSASEAIIPKEREELMASLSATAVFDSSFEDEGYNRNWLGWEQEGPSKSWDDSSEPLASGMDIGYKDIINSAEELAMTGGSRTAVFHLFDKLVPDPDSDLRFLHRSQSNILISIDDDDDYFEREAYVDAVTPLDERLFVGSDIAVTRLSKGRRKSSGSGSGASPPSSDSGPPGSHSSLDRQRKRQA
uniref:Uncharacterized protein n=1 Tax=Tetraselmis chuii TaxID=63592 RepID=A0A7S1X2F8_9CHLO